MKSNINNETDKISDKIKDRWDKGHIISNSIAILLVPAFIGYFGHQINAAVKDKEIGLRYVEIAIGILRGDPDKESPALRDWAISIVNANSPVQLNSKVREELKRKPLRSVRLARSLQTNTDAPSAPTKFLLDSNGNILTDSQGNQLTAGGSEPLAFDDGSIMTYDDGKPVTGGKSATIGSKSVKH